jgi:HEAT repeat protein
MEAGNTIRDYKEFAAELASPLLAVVEEGGTCSDSALSGLINLGEGVREGVAADRAMPLLIGLVEQALDGGDHLEWSTAQSALLLMGNFGEMAAPAVPVLVRVLREREENFDRRYALMSLAEIGDPSAAAAPALLELLGPSEDDSYERNEIRYDVARTLGSIPAAAATTAPALVTALSSEDYTLPSIAAGALAELGGAGVPAVLKELESEDEERLERAISILVEIGPEAASAAPALVPLLLSESWNVSYEAGAALRTLGASEAAVPALIEILENDGNEDAQEAAAEVLANYGETARPALPALRKLAKDGGWSVKRMAESAVEMIEGGGQ